MFQGNHCDRSSHPPPAFEAHLGYWLRRVSNHVSGSFARALQGHDVSVAEWVVVRLVAGAARPTAADLAATTGLTPGAVSKIVDKLDRKGLIAREQNPDDSRVQWLSLARAGRHLVPKLTAIADDNDARFFGCLTALERAELRRLLAKIGAAHALSDVPLD